MNTNNHYGAIVIGAGTAGLSAGIYLSRARIRILILSEGTVGRQMILTHEIANYPEVECLSGYQLSVIMKTRQRNLAVTSKHLHELHKDKTLLSVKQKV